MLRGMRILSTPVTLHPCSDQFPLGTRALRNSGRATLCFSRVPRLSHYRKHINFSASILSHHQLRGLRWGGLHKAARGEFITRLERKASRLRVPNVMRKLVDLGGEKRGGLCNGCSALQWANRLVQDFR